MPAALQSLHGRLVSIHARNADECDVAFGENFRGSLEGMNDREGRCFTALGKIGEGAFETLADDVNDRFAFIAVDDDADVVGTGLIEQVVPQAGFAENVLVGRRAHHDGNSIDVVGLAEISRNQHQAD